MLNPGRFVEWVRAALAGLAVMTAGSAIGGPPPIEHFTQRPALSGVVVSPSGNRLAVLVFGPDGKRALAVMDLDPVGKARVVASFADADVTKAHWATDNRLVFEASQTGAVVREGGAGVFAVNHDGTEQRTLIAWRHSIDATASSIRSRTLPYGWFLHSTIDDGSNEVFVYREAHDKLQDLKHIELARLNTSSGMLRPLSYGMPQGARTWFVDEKHEPRLLTSYREGRRRIYWRSPGTDKWDEVADFDPLSEAGWFPWLIDAGGQIIVTARSGSDTTSLHKFDPVARQVDPEPLMRVTGFDLSTQAKVDSRTGRLVGVDFRADRPMSYWFDSGLESVQRGVDGALAPGRSNRLYCGRCETTRFFVVHSSSDRQPGEYFLFDRSKASLSRIGASRPWIDEASQGSRTLHRVSTRDGLQMPVYVTHPAGFAVDKPLPTVVLVHGGPWVRGSDLGWDAEAQFLASRGYRVLQPEFRGSLGYGRRHFESGWKEWGRAMQTDLVDAVHWAAKQGLVDASRVCIAGASYGGYAALMGPITDPGVYRCAASFAGVTDIGLMYSITWSDTSDSSRRYGMPVLIGDPVKDAERLAMASPLQRAAEIKVPLLVAHGAADRRVPIDHSRKFVDAARRAGVAVEQVNYAGEGHGFSDPANETDYFGRLERFFEKSLQSAR